MVFSEPLPTRSAVGSRFCFFFWKARKAHLEAATSIVEAQCVGLFYASRVGEHVLDLFTAFATITSKTAIRAPFFFRHVSNQGKGCVKPGSKMN